MLKTKAQYEIFLNTVYDRYIYRDRDGDRDIQFPI